MKINFSDPRPPTALTFHPSFYELLTKKIEFFGDVIRGGWGGHENNVRVSLSVGSFEL